MWRRFESSIRSRWGLVTTTSAAALIAVATILVLIPPSASATHMCNPSGGPSATGECTLVGAWTNFWWGTQATKTGATASNTYHVPALVEPIGYAELDQTASVGAGTAGTSTLYVKVTYNSDHFVAWKTGTTASYQIYGVFYGNGSVGASVTCGSSGTASANSIVYSGFRPYDVTTSTWVGSGDSTTTVYNLGSFTSLSCSSAGSVSGGQSFSSGTSNTNGNMSTNIGTFTLTNGDTYYICFWFMAETTVTTTSGTGTSGTACADFSHSGSTGQCTKNGFVGLDFGDII